MGRWAELNAPLLVLVPAFAIISLFVLAPFMVTVGLSLSDYSPTLPNRGAFVGLQNYRDAFADVSFWQSVWFSLRFAFTIVLVESILGFCLAMWLRSLQRPLLVIPVLMIPSLVPSVTVALAWKFILQADFGVGPYLAEALLGIQNLTAFNDPMSAFWALVVVDVWQWTPLVGVILFAGLASVPRQSIEAARVDGAGAFRTTTSIIFPAVRPFVAVAITLRLIDGLRIFDSVYVLTGGGPGNSTESLNLFLWRTSFKFWESGYGASLAMLGYLMTLVGLALVFARLRRVLRWQ